MPSRRRRLVAGSLSVATAYLAIVLGALDGLVWMPQAVAPTTPLPDIYRTLQHSGDLVGCVASIVLWFAFWRSPVALAATLLCLPDRSLGRLAHIRPLDALLSGAPLLLGIVLFQFLTTFAMGMNVSDELPPGVGVNSAFGALYYEFGLLAGATGTLVLGVRVMLWRLRSRRSRIGAPLNG